MLFLGADTNEKSVKMSPALRLLKDVQQTVCRPWSSTRWYDVFGYADVKKHLERAKKPVFGTSCCCDGNIEVPIQIFNESYSN